MKDAPVKIEVRGPNTIVVIIRRMDHKLISFFPSEDLLRYKLFSTPLPHLFSSRDLLKND